MPSIVYTLHIDRVVEVNPSLGQCPYSSVHMIVTRDGQLPLTLDFDDKKQVQVEVEEGERVSLVLDFVDEGKKSITSIGESIIAGREPAGLLRLATIERIAGEEDTNLADGDVDLGDEGDA